MKPSHRKSASTLILGQHSASLGPFANQVTCATPSVIGKSVMTSRLCVRSSRFTPPNRAGPAVYSCTVSGQGTPPALPCSCCLTGWFFWRSSLLRGCESCCGSCPFTRSPDRGGLAQPRHRCDNQVLQRDLQLPSPPRPRRPDALRTTTPEDPDPAVTHEGQSRW